MAESQHTPGPWDAKDNRAANAVDREPVWIVVDANGHVTADCDGLELADPNHAEANARLIAAAPDLLAVCEEIVRIVEVKHPILDAASAAIAKARG